MRTRLQEVQEELAEEQARAKEHEEQRGKQREEKSERVEQSEGPAREELMQSVLETSELVSGLLLQERDTEGQMRQLISHLQHRLMAAEASLFVLQNK